MAGSEKYSGCLHSHKIWLMLVIAGTLVEAASCNTGKVAIWHRFPHSMVALKYSYSSPGIPEFQKWVCQRSLGKLCLSFRQLQRPYSITSTKFCCHMSTSVPPFKEEGHRHKVSVRSVTECVSSYWNRRGCKCGPRAGAPQDFRADLCHRQAKQNIKLEFLLWKSKSRE